MECIQWKVESKGNKKTETLEQPINREHVIALRFSKQDIENYTDNFNDKMINASENYNFKYLNNKDGSSTAMIQSNNLEEVIGRSVDLFRLSLIIMNS